MEPRSVPPFRSERQQPFDDLLALCHAVPGVASWTSGCTGPPPSSTSSSPLKQPRVDSSEAMLTRPARTTTTSPDSPSPRRHRHLAREDLDLVFANASLQWSTTTSTCWRACDRTQARGQLRFRSPPTSGTLALIARESRSRRRSSTLTAMSPRPGRFVLSPELYATSSTNSARKPGVRMESTP